MFFRLLLRSVFVEIFWTKKDLQRFSVSWIITPLLRRFYPENWKEIRASYCEKLFNTTSVAVPAIIGLIWNLEKKVKENVITREELFYKVQMLQAPLAAVGDMLFWGSIYPLLVVLELLLVGLGWKVFVVVAGIVWTLFLMAFRSFLLARSLAEGEEFFYRFSMFPYLKVSRFARIFTFLLASVVVFMFPLTTSPSGLTFKLLGVIFGLFFTLMTEEVDVLILSFLVYVIFLLLVRVKL